MFRKGLFAFTLPLLLILGACGDRPGTVDPPADPPSSSPDAVIPPDQDDAPQTDSAQPASSDMTIIPGEQVGSVTSATSRADLAEIYGESALTDKAIPVGEGFTEPGTVVKLENGQSFSVIWLNEDRSKPLLVRDFSAGWQTPEGLGMGSSFAEVKNVLGSFKLYGMGWDYEGSLILEGSNLDRYYGDLLLRVRPDPAAIQAHPEAYQSVSGDAIFEADNPNFEPLDLTVDDMIVYLNPLPEQ